jgi:hypothetical protein
MAQNGGQDDRDKRNSNHKKYEKLYHWVYVFGVSVLFVVIDFVFLWPENHFFALLALAAIFSLTAIYELTVIGFWWTHVWGVVAVIFVLAMGVYFIVGPVPPPPPWRGWLQPANEPTPENGCGERWREAPILLAGSNGVIFRNPLGRVRVIAIDNCDALVFDRSENGIKVTAPLFDDAGNSLGEIVDKGYSIQKNTNVVV